MLLIRGKDIVCLLSTALLHIPRSSTPYASDLFWSINSSAGGMILFSINRFVP